MKTSSVGEKFKKLFSCKIMVVIMIIAYVVIYFNIKSLINDKNIYIENIQKYNTGLMQKLYEAKKNEFIQNKDTLTKYLTLNFPELKEYRVVEIIESNSTILRVIIDEPIKDEQSVYQRSNWIDVNAVIEPGIFIIKNFTQSLTSTEDDKRLKVGTVENPIIFVKVDKLK